MSHERTFSDSNPMTTIEEKKRNSLSILIDNINLTSLNSYYNKEESVFKKRVDLLNMKFYLETEKYLSSKENNDKIQDKLFVILFKQISLYIEEIERLNNSIYKKEFSKNDKNKSSDLQVIKNLKKELKTIETRMSGMNESIIKLRTENEILKKQNEFYFDQNKQSEVNSGKKESKKETNKTKIMSPVSIKSLDVADTTVHTNKQSEDNNTVNLSKILSKKRNYSDNNPNQNNKKRDSKEPVEVNNININLNLHLKNNNNTNINLIDKRDLNTKQAYNSKLNNQLDIKSPIKIKQTFTDIAKNKIKASEAKNVCFLIKIISKRIVTKMQNIQATQVAVITV